MSEYKVSFEAISPHTIEELSQRLYERYDSILVEREGRITVGIYLEAESGFTAAKDAVLELEAMGFCIVRVDPDLVDAPEIAERLGVSRQAVSHWAQGSRGSGFPHPLSSPGGKRIWAWGQITEWASREGKYRDALALSLDDSARIDAWLAERRLSVSAGARRATVSPLLRAGRSKSVFASYAGPGQYRDRHLRVVGER